MKAAIRHLCRYGDTDIFPHLPELAFFADDEGAIIDELSKLDLDSYAPAGAFEALAPKGRYAFRIAHQLPALETLLLLACVVEVGEKIEAKRQAPESARAFSYRFSVDTKTSQVFRPDRTFKDWLHRQQEIIDDKRQIKKIVSTDISDFYTRINVHRIENLLDEAAPGSGAVRFIKKHIKAIRAKQSFGLPVGGSASRLLAELALSDTDQALKDNGLIASRFVDDFRVFLRGTDSPYDALGYLAEQLGINEGLSLNAAKTNVQERRDYIKYLDRLTLDPTDDTDGVGLEALTAELYSNDEPDEEDLAQLKGIDLIALLEKEIRVDGWDLGKIRVLFRALKIARPKDSVIFIEDNFETLVIFAKEVCLLMEALVEDEPNCLDHLLEEVLDAILAPPASCVQLIRTWLLEIFVRGIIPIPLTKVKQLEALPAVIDKRQLLLIRGRCNDKNYFRRQKTAIHNFSDLELSCLVWGASCLPKDEYEKWIDHSKASFNKPLGALFLKWAVSNRNSLISKLEGIAIDHAD